MKKRIVYFDYLRLAATVGIIVLHLAGAHWLDFGGRSLRWNVLNVYEVAVRWAVPIFVMLSGSLFLSREPDIKQLYKKNILRMVVAYFAWSVFYALTDPLINMVLFGEYDLSVSSVVSGILRGSYHMWFIPMIVGLYMCTPVLKEIVRKKTVAKYFLMLSFVFVFLLPQAVSLSRDFAGGLFAEIMGSLDAVISSDMRFHFVKGYTVYFILGYLLEEAELSKKQRTLVYILGVVGFATSIALNSIVSWKTGEPCSTYYEPFCVNTLLVVIAVHTWFKYREYRHETRNRIVSALAGYSFGVYLVHAFVLDVLHVVGLNAVTWNPVISIPVVTLAAAAISFGISWAVHRIPVLNKWIV